MGTGAGDKLASGRSVKASWGPLEVTQDKWDAAFTDENPSTTGNAATESGIAATKKLRTPRKTTAKKSKRAKTQ